MKIIDIYYQGEGVGALEHLEFDAEATFAALQAAIAGKHVRAGLSRGSLSMVLEVAVPADAVGLSPIAAGKRPSNEQCQAVRYARANSSRTCSLPTFSVNRRRGEHNQLNSLL
jgi:hypothetical protein